MNELLLVQNISRRFGGLLALDRASFFADEGQIVALIGPNGAGKTTLFSIITGFLDAHSGHVRLHGEDITGTPPHLLARRGIARTFQIAQPFAGLTVRENIAVGSHLRASGAPPRSRPRRSVAAEVGLAPMLDQPASNLTVAGRKRLELARALAIEPKLLLLDEVLAGLNPSEVRDMVPVIQAIRARGITIVMIEHVMQAVMSLAEQVFVLAEGRIIAMGAAGKHRRRPARGRGLSRPRRRRNGCAPMAELLAISGLRAGYGATEVLRGIDLAVNEGEIVAVLGSNGAGKSTLNRAISGVLRPWRGAIRFGGTAIERARPSAIVARGLIHVPEGRRIFPNMSVRENLDLGCYRRARPRREQNRERVFGIFPRLAERQAQSAGTLSGGEQQMLAIGRGLMAEPKLLILDEPSLGLSPLLVEELFALIKSINAPGHRAAAGRAERGAKPRRREPRLRARQRRDCAAGKRGRRAQRSEPETRLSGNVRWLRVYARVSRKSRSWSHPACTIHSPRWSPRRRASTRYMSPAPPSRTRGSGGPTSASSA